MKMPLPSLAALFTFLSQLISYSQPAIIDLKDGSERIAVIDRLDHQIISHEHFIFDFAEIDQITFHLKQDNGKIFRQFRSDIYTYTGYC